MVLRGSITSESPEFAERSGADEGGTDLLRAWEEAGDSNAKRMEGLPRVPPKFCLAGHRESVTALYFRPLYSILASASKTDLCVFGILKGHAASQVSADLYIIVAF